MAGKVMAADKYLKAEELRILVAKRLNNTFHGCTIMPIPLMPIYLRSSTPSLSLITLKYIFLYYAYDTEWDLGKR